MWMSGSAKFQTRHSDGSSSNHLWFLQKTPKAFTELSSLSFFGVSIQHQSGWSHSLAPVNFWSTVQKWCVFGCFYPFSPWVQDGPSWSKMVFVSHASQERPDAGRLRPANPHGSGLVAPICCFVTGLARKNMTRYQENPGYIIVLLYTMIYTMTYPFTSMLVLSWKML